eukprot:SAG31_NODE_8636_length_1416_cov_5.760061_2_plen_176_part_00
MAHQAERRRASIVDVLQGEPSIASAADSVGQQQKEVSIEKVWAGVASVVENIYEELDKRLAQQQLFLSSQLLGPGSPAGDVMESFNKARVKFKQNCAALLEAFTRDFGAAKTKYERSIAAGKAGTSSKAQLQKLYAKYERKLTELRECGHSSASLPLCLHGATEYDTCGISRQRP